MNRIVEILIERDGMSVIEAEKALADAQLRVFEGEDPVEILEEEFGLEPDYIDDLV